MNDRRAITDPFSVNLTAAVVLRGEAMALREFVKKLETDAARAGVAIVFVKVSGGKLWVKEGEEP